jgi:hypothetical protein
MDFIDEHYLDSVNRWFDEYQPETDEIAIYPDSISHTRNCECPVCLEVVPHAEIESCATCNYGFHKSCLSGLAKCPMCRALCANTSVIRKITKKQAKIIYFDQS